MAYEQWTALLYPAAAGREPFWRRPPNILECIRSLAYILACVHELISYIMLSWLQALAREAPSAILHCFYQLYWPIISHMIVY